MKIRCTVATAACLLLVGCGSTSTTATPDDGTVNGRTTEDAGGDGTNTTGGDGMSSSQGMMLKGDANLSVGTHSSTFSF